MTVTTARISFAEYLQCQEKTDDLYELVDGELFPMGLGTGRHGALAKRLERIFDDEVGQNKLPWTAQKFALGIRSPRGRRGENEFLM